jgi:hypothetical protein
MNTEDLFALDPYCLDRVKKQQMLCDILYRMTINHTQKGEAYRNVINALPLQIHGGISDITQLPMLPVRLFKYHELKSVPDESVIKTLTSSGTTSQIVSRIFLDKETSLLQTKALVNIVKSFIGSKRLPMILVDTSNIIKDRTSFSARGAGLLGLTNFGRDHFYLLNEEMDIDQNGLQQFLERHKEEKILLFGFTFMIWKYFYEACKRADTKIDLGESILIHSGGWKKLQESAVDNGVFKSSLKDQLGVKSIYNFYGMVEQVGSIYMECQEGYLHSPNFADIIIRDPISLQPLPIGHTGVIQTLSILPRSYPGHSLLTEDSGVILGEDDCVCGRKGKYFKVFGRLPAAELRGCSDTHAFDRRIS